MKPSRLVPTIALSLALLLSRSSSAADLTLAWDPPSDGLTTGYILLYGTASQSYSQQIDVGFTNTYTLSNLTLGATYFFAVRAYDAAGALSTPSTEITATPTLPAVTSLALSSNVQSPQLVGTTVDWLAVAGGGIAPYEFQWSLFNGTAWTTWPWSTAANWTWTPTTPSSSYQIKVAARSAGSASTTGEMTQSVPFVATTPKVASAKLVSNLPAPQNLGVTVLWTASGTGGVAPYQYKWWLYNGSTWTAVTGWTSSDTWTWTPTVAVNNYSVRVWIRSAGSTVDAAEASATVPFGIKPAKGKKK